ncbi:hypothetical protein COE94_19485 [Bacillus toyonensis]|uniref:hypothetical protein n=1 Tax=Bacillus toyonensis TaxID=155322 RepID=UPI000BFE0DFA|nr:hypothetical protein [Bacillus toyonensis]PHB83014.1 hypothetical protein COE94_19485 [Bacillus toyonensis]
MFAEFKFSEKNLWELIVDICSVAFVIYFMVINLPKTNLSNFNMFLVTLLSVVMMYFCFGVIRPFADKLISISRKGKE